MEQILRLLDDRYHLEALGERIIVYRDDVSNRYIYLDMSTYQLEIVRFLPDDTEELLYDEIIFNRPIQEISNILDVYI